MVEAVANGVPSAWATRDWLTRAFVVFWFFVLEVFLAWRLVAAIHATHTYDALGLARLVADACLFLFVAMMVGLTILREPPRLQAAGVWPRIAAVIGTNILVIGIFVLPAPRPLGMYQSVASAVLILTGNLLCVVVLRRLGRSFSIMAEARTLVTDGPYAIVRHPLYLVEELACVGAFIHVVSWSAALLYAVHFGFQVQRMVNEERVLLRAFPRQYSAYAARTARLIPGIW